MKRKVFYMANVIVKEQGVTVGGLMKSKIELTWADGMIGVAPMFSSKKKAERHAKQYNATVSTFTIDEKSNKT